MRGTWALLLWAGCFSPSYTTGAPCDPALNNCPQGQTCLPAGTGFACGGGDAIDAPTDAESDATDASTDIDGDGILNAADNCPTIANADQADDEEDDIGDVCDPCPVTVDNTDTDGDKVGDRCDPNPLTPGDRIVLFESFNADGLPTGWATGGNGTWTFDDGDAEINLGGGQVGALRTNFPATAKMTAFTAVTITDQAGPDSGAGIANPFTQNYDGTQCGLFRNGGGGGGGNSMSLYNLTNSATINESLTSWSLNTPYVVITHREGNDYECVFANIVGTVLAQPMGTNNSNHTGTQTVGLRARGVTAVYQFVMIVESP